MIALLYIGMHCHKCGLLLDGYEEEQEEEGFIYCPRDAIFGKKEDNSQEPFNEEY